FKYETPFLALEAENDIKRYNKVILWVDDFGDWDISLDYWVSYRQTESLKKSRSQTINLSDQSSIGLWDVGVWDEAYWDEVNIDLKPLVFNLGDGNEGDAIKLRFRQNGVDNPVTAYGFSIIYSI